MNKLQGLNSHLYLVSLQMCEWDLYTSFVIVFFSQASSRIVEWGVTEFFFILKDKVCNLLQFWGIYKSWKKEQMRTQGWWQIWPEIWIARSWISYKITKKDYVAVYLRPKYYSIICCAQRKIEYWMIKQKVEQFLGSLSLY